MADGVSTLPEGWPKRTLGWGVLKHAQQFLRQPNGPKAGQLWSPTPSQARFVTWWYAVDDDGRWLFHHGVRRLAKGSGKSPFAAVLALEELVGPVRLKDMDPGVRGGCVGMAVALPLVQIAATAESQTANTMRMVRAMAAKKSRVVSEYQIDVGKTIFYTPSGGQLEIITSSASAAEGAEVTFAIEDETEHWVPASGGPLLAETLDGNLAKSSSRAIETANAWIPGIDSVAEKSYDAWVAQQEGRTKGESRILYDARIAPADTDLASEESLIRALEFVYDDCFWVDRRTIIERIWDPRTRPDDSRRKYLNQPTATDDAWTTPMAWAALEGKRPVESAEDVVLFFDGSRSDDATALIGCCMSDGYVFTVGVWQPTPGNHVPVTEVDAAVERAFDTWTVVAFFADVQEWEGFVKVTWPDRYAARLVVMASPTGKEPHAIAWDMRSKVFDFTAAVELTLTEIGDKAFAHDGDSTVARHVVNARRRPNRWGVSIAKEARESSKKIDAAVCVIGARMARRIVLASPQWEKYLRRKNRGKARVIVFD